MKLDELIAGAPVRIITGDARVEISGISYNSREVRPGYLFFSLARDPVRNRANLDDALNRGARAVVVDGSGGGKGEARLAAEVSAGQPTGTVVDAPQPRLLMGWLRRAFSARRASA